MTLPAVVNPYQPLVGLTGMGVNNGSLYIGVDGQDPEGNPQACFWDAAGTIPAAQPIQVLGGYPMRLGTPAQVFTAATYSMRLRDVSTAQVFYLASAAPNTAAASGLYGTRADAMAAQVPASVHSIRVAGFAAVGDGLDALYVEGGSGSLPGLTSADGRHWQYVPEAEGFNATAWGIGLGAVDDGPAIQTLLGYFSADGRTLDRSATILFPGPSNLKTPVVIPGGPTFALTLRGAGPQGRGLSGGAAWTWTGLAGTSAVICYGANQALFDSITVDARGGSGLANCVHVAADNVVNTTLSGPVAIGAGVVATPVAMTNIAAGMALGIGSGADFEVVYVTAVIGATFTATFRKAHLTAAKVGGSSGSSGVTFRSAGFGVPAGAASAGIWWGNHTASATPQVSEGRTENCYLIGAGAAGSAYSAMRVTTGGNVKNFGFLRTTAVGFKRPFAIETGSGSIFIQQPILAATTEADFATAGGAEIVVSGGESEPNAGAMVLTGTGGAGSQSVTLIGFDWEGAGPGDDFVIRGVAALTLIGNKFNNTRTGASVPKIEWSGLGGGAALTTPGSVTSIDNFYQNATDLTDVFCDGSGNALGHGGDFAALKNHARLVSLGDYGANYLLPRMSELSLVSSGLSVEGADAAAVFGSTALAGQTYQTVTIPFGAFQAAALTHDVLTFSVPPRTKITDVVADVTTPFQGPAGAVTMRWGVTAGGQELFVDFDAKTAAIVRGLADADLGAGMTTAGRVQGGYRYSWTTSTQVSCRLISGAGNLSGLTQGSVTLYISVERVN